MPVASRDHYLARAYLKVKPTWSRVEQMDWVDDVECLDPDVPETLKLHKQTNSELGLPFLIIKRTQPNAPFELSISIIHTLQVNVIRHLPVKRWWKNLTLVPTSMKETCIFLQS